MAEDLAGGWSLPALLADDLLLVPAGGIGGTAGGLVSEGLSAMLDFSIS